MVDLLGSMVTIYLSIGTVISILTILLLILIQVTEHRPAGYLQWLAAISSVILWAPFLIRAVTHKEHN